MAPVDRELAEESGRPPGPDRDLDPARRPHEILGGSCRGRTSKSLSEYDVYTRPTTAATGTPSSRTQIPSSSGIQRNRPACFAAAGQSPSWPRTGSVRGQNGNGSQRDRAHLHG